MARRPSIASTSFGLFDQVVVDMSKPAVDIPAPLPVVGSTIGARHASASGAAAAAKTRPQIAEAYLELFTNDGFTATPSRVYALSDHEAVEELQRRFLIVCGLSTINSTRNTYNRVAPGEPFRIVDSGTFEDHTFADGRKTKRTRWIPQELLDTFLDELDRDQKLTAEIRAHIERVRAERASFPPSISTTTEGA